jgi:tetratricopeptide (TPR) repeat protein
VDFHSILPTLDSVARCHGTGARISFFQGLSSCEIVLLVLGVILFVALLVLPIVGRKGLLAYSLLPVIMIGYPSIQSIEYKDGTVTIETATDALLQNPTNPDLRNTVEQQLAKIESRPVPNASVAASIARAQFATGKETAATANLQKALQADPKLPAALALQQKINAIHELEPLTAAVKANPQDPAAKAQLAKGLENATKQPVANPEALVKLAQAQAAIGNQQGALNYAEKALTINPKATAAIELKNSMQPPH